jgi:hypothetical protein
MEWLVRIPGVCYFPWIKSKVYLIGPGNNSIIDHHRSDYVGILIEKRIIRGLARLLKWGNLEHMDSNGEKFSCYRDQVNGK